MSLASNLEPSLALLGLGAARTVPLVWSVPVFGGPALPGQIRVALGLGLAVLCYPALASASPPADTVSWALLATREALVGVVMGLVCAAMFRAAAAAGELTDVLRGANLASVLWPAGEERTSPLGALLLLFASVVFLESGGVGHVVSALGRSYEAIPLGVPLQIGESSRAAALLAITASAKLIEAAIGLAAPALVALLLADIVLGAIGRAVPGVPLYFVGMPLRALLGVAAVLLALGGLDLAIENGFRGFFGLLAAAFRPGR
ncbi:MAG: flagellar biosynthetic protein FliR [Deltaproteobacteria bacterium]|nr:flagellar biosynthetic protein FliR [Deltaproteobacteria bacterium]